MSKENKLMSVIKDFLNEDECNTIIEHFNNNKEIDIDFLKTKILIAVKENFNTQFNGYGLSDITDFNFNTYEVSKGYVDFESDDDDEKYVTFMVQLNNDYKGGFYQFLINEGENYYQMEHGAGYLVIYYSNLPQRMLTVKRGTKYTITGCLKLVKDHNYKKTII
jgi:predicted 2-oxoglutarate/Fe(II)-dependent dioxygenase YbiX